MVTSQKRLMTSLIINMGQKRLRFGKQIRKITKLENFSLTWQIQIFMGYLHRWAQVR